MGFAIIAALLEGCSGGYNGGSSGSGGSSGPAASPDELKFNPNDVDSELRSKGKNPSVSTQHSGGTNLFGFPVYDGCGYNALTDQYVCVDDNYSQREFQNLNITSGAYTINTVTITEDSYNVDHYSPLRIVNDANYREPSDNWWPSTSQDDGYEYTPPAPPPSSSWGTPSSSQDDNYGGGSSTSGSSWGTPSGSQDDNYGGGSSTSGSSWGTPSSSQDDNYGGGSSTSGSSWGTPSSSGSDWGTPSSSGSDWGSSSSSSSSWGTPSTTSQDDNYADNILTPFLALTGQAQAYSQRAIVYNPNGSYYAIGAQQYVIVPGYSAPTLIGLGYKKDWVDYLSDYNVSKSSMTVYYTKDGVSQNVQVSINAPANSSPTTWARGQRSGNTAELETLSKILQGTYVPPAPPAPVVVPSTTPTTGGSQDDNYDAPTTGTTPSSTTTTTTTTTTVETK